MQKNRKLKSVDRYFSSKFYFSLITCNVYLTILLSDTFPLVIFYYKKIKKIRLKMIDGKATSN